MHTISDKTKLIMNSSYTHAINMNRAFFIPSVYCTLGTMKAFSSYVSPTESKREVWQPNHLPNQKGLSCRAYTQDCCVQLRYRTPRTEHAVYS